MMPMSPPRPCNYPACPALTYSRFCPTHQHASDAGRLSSSRRGYTSSEWKATRAQVLLRDPLCVECKAAPSTDAAHLIARAKGGSDELSNLRGLCHSCHSRETARDDNGFGNAMRVSA